ncbi:MAG: alpha/beta hydrolase, partial [Acidobacteriota bacterium]|nr:alpha/beta hydrolase [Acidobacteriota bacterium]
AASPTAPEAPLPDVPTLILSGAEDLRTPLANAQAVAAAIPDAQLLVVPQTGHSVLGAEPSECAHEALLAFFEAKPLRACHAAHLPASLLPPPLPPLRVAALSTIRGYRNRAGRTLHGVGLTFAALDSELVLTLTDELISHTSGGLGPVAVGGLRSGWARYDKSRITLHRYSYIPGLTLSGSLGPNGLRLRIGGRGALHGTLRNGWGTMLLGRLGGRRVDVSSKAISASATASAATARTASAAAGAGTGIAGIAGPTRDPYAVVRRLERILGLR